MRNVHVLLVEDYSASVLVATTYLDVFGYTYDVVDDAAAAVKLAAENDYAVILMDVETKGMNGYDGTRLIRSNEIKSGKQIVPIIGMTAHHNAGNECFGAGMNDYLSKPFAMEVFESKLKRWISR